MRLIASAGIVWFHSHAPGQSISYSALSLFIVFLIVLPLQHSQTGRSKSYILQRADRLLRPWMIWSVIFAVLKALQAIFEKRLIGSEFEWSMLVMGTQTHLWFLPFGFVCSVAAFALVRSIDIEGPVAFPFFTVLATLSVPLSAFFLNKVLSDPWAQWCYGLPAVLFAVAIHCAKADRRNLALVSIASVLGWFGAYQIEVVNWGFDSLAIGVNFAIVALSVQVRSRPWMRWAASLSMPIYLIHPVFIALLQGWAGFENGVNLALLTIFLSLFFGFAVIKAGWTRKLL